MEHEHRSSVKSLLQQTAPQASVRVHGWVRTRRDSKDFSFLEVNDGSCLANVQVIVDADLPCYAQIHEIYTGAAVTVVGSLVESPGKGQSWEIRASDITLVGAAPNDYPLQKKRHSDEFLRSIAHLRVRTNKYGAVARIRSRLSWAVHDFFQARGFHYVHTPIITSSDCEGAGELFRVTTMDPTHTRSDTYGRTFADDFFGKPAFLTVSGQLAVETYCLGLSNVYTFGPTFRSENSNTSRHMAEFWMIEPEIAFADLKDDMDLAEQMVQSMVRFALEDCVADIELFTRFVDTELRSRLENIVNNRFARVSYGEAIEILRSSGRNFEFEPTWGNDLQSEHERYLSETHFRKPVFVHDWPRDIKAFYMRTNDDGRTVAAMDLLIPGVGELIGGSQREERIEPLEARMRETGLSPDDYWWYLDTRRYGSAPHAGFGLGFERLLMLVTGISNIRDVIPFPRTPNTLEY